MNIQNLIELGLIFYAAAGIQIDITVVRKADGSEGSGCDHNCTLEVGNYDCPAAFSKNRGMNKQFAPVEDIIRWVELAAQANLAQRRRFTQDDQGYFEENHIPANLRQPICDHLLSGVTEVNLFAGNPEMHPEVIEIISRLQALGYRVNFTTTGRRFIYDSAYRAGIYRSPPHLIAVSADDIEPDPLEELLGMDLDALQAKHRKIPRTHGQKQKFVEAIYTSALFVGRPAPKILYNMVIHPGNLAHAERMIGRLRIAFPNNLVNPYPAQSSFGYGAPCFQEEHLPEFDRFVDLMIAWSKDPASPITKRLHYWLVLKAVLTTHWSSPSRILQMLSGYDTWRCYRRPLLPYVQIGKGKQGTKAPGIIPGGKLGCFWNDQTVSEELPVNSVAQVEEYLASGMQAHAMESENECTGCLMPRLKFHFITTELGLDPELMAAYLPLRKEHVGF